MKRRFNIGKAFTDTQKQAETAEVAEVTPDVSPPKALPPLTQVMDELRELRADVTELKSLLTEALHGNLTDVKDILIQAFDIQESPETSVAHAVDTQFDPLAPLRAIEALTGLHEVKNEAEIVNSFSKHGINIDPVKDSWCGATIRYGICEAGLPDPGEAYHKAAEWQHYGEASAPDTPGTIVVYHSHVSLITEDGGEIGGNVTNSVRVMPKGQNWFGTPIAYRKPIG